MTGERVEFGVRVVGGEFVLATYRTRREAAERIALVAAWMAPLEIVQHRVTPWELAETEENR